MAATAADHANIRTRIRPDLCRCRQLAIDGLAGDDCGNRRKEIVTLGLTIGFGKSDNLAAAYGIAVSATMLMTTALLFIAMREIWCWTLPAAAAVASAFFIVDAAFLAANLAKVADGGYVPLLLAAAVYGVMLIWHTGAQAVSARLQETVVPVATFMARIAEGRIPRVPTRRPVLGNEVREPGRPYSTVMFSDLVGYTALSVRIHTVAERVRKTLTWISMSGKCLSLLCLHRLEEGEDGPQRLVVQHSLPVRHAFFSPAMRDREVEHVGGLLAVAALEPAQVSGRIRTNRVRRMAMRAILVEQAAPGSAPACVVRTGRDGKIVGAHRCDRQTKQSGQ